MSIVLGASFAPSVQGPYAQVLPSAEARRYADIAVVLTAGRRLQD